MTVEFRLLGEVEVLLDGPRRHRPRPPALRSRGVAGRCEPAHSGGAAGRPGVGGPAPAPRPQRAAGLRVAAAAEARRRRRRADRPRARAATCCGPTRYRWTAPLPATGRRRPARPIDPAAAAALLRPRPGAVGRRAVRRARHSLVQRRSDITGGRAALGRAGSQRRRVARRTARRTARRADRGCAPTRSTSAWPAS